MIRIFIIFAALLLFTRAEVVTAIDPSDDLPQGKTVVWSPLFQAMWDQMNAELGGKPVKVDPPNELMARLDGFEWDAEKVMPKESWKVWGGEATKAFLETVNKEAAAITGDAEGPFKLMNEAPGGLACFGLLDREVEFQFPFFKSRKVPMKFGADKSEVSYFGANGKLSGEYEESVKVLAFRPVDGSCALEISCRGGDDKVVFYRPHETQDFATACKWLRKWKKDFIWNAELPGTWADRLLHENDEIKIPYVSLDVSEEFSPRLESARYYRGVDFPSKIQWAEQITKFELFERGARVRVETGADVDPFGGDAEPRTVPRRFIFDKPFFVFLWREGAEWPYFGVWVGDESALLKF